MASPFFDNTRNKWIMTLTAILSMNVTFQTYGFFIIGTVLVTFYLYMLEHGNVDNLFANVILKHNRKDCSRPKFVIASLLMQYLDKIQTLYRYAAVFP